MIRRPPRPTRTAPLFPLTALFRSSDWRGSAASGEAAFACRHREEPASGERSLSGGVQAQIREAGKMQSQPRFGHDYQHIVAGFPCRCNGAARPRSWRRPRRSEEHTSELQSLMRISYAVFCLKKKKQKKNIVELRHNIRYNIKQP